METDKSQTESNIHSHMKFHNVREWVLSGRPDRLKSSLLAGAFQEDARTIMEALKRTPERSIVRRLARYYDCEETPEAIRDAVKKSSESRLIRRLARALALPCREAAAGQ